MLCWLYFLIFVSISCSMKIFLVFSSLVAKAGALNAARSLLITDAHYAKGTILRQMPTHVWESREKEGHTFG